jgi:uncharacterized membrane protein
VHSGDSGNRGQALIARYIQPSVLVAHVLGIGISIYLTFVHFAAAQLVCSTGGAVDCERVLSSAYAVIAGTPIPTSAAGIAWFGIGAALAVFRVRRAQVAWSLLGLLTVLFLVYVEIVQLGAICIWCTAAHALVVVIFLLTVTIRAPES